MILLRDHEVDRFVKLSTREVDCPDQSFSRRRQAQVVVVALDRGDVELPRLPTVDHPQALLVCLDVVEIDLSRESDVLFHPRVFDGAGVNPVQPFRQIAERAIDRTLHVQDVRHLTLVQNALLYQNLTDANPLHIYLVENNIVCIDVQLRPLR